MLLNPLRVNDWRIGATLKGIALALSVLWVIAALEAGGLTLPLARALVGTVCLLFVPGMLALRALRMHDLGSVRTVLFAVGLSITLVMVMGLFANATYPLLGISRPLTPWSVLVTFSIMVSALAVLSYVRDRQHASNDVVLDRADVLSPHVLLLCLIPFGSVVATYVMNAYQSNVALLALIVGLGVVIAWVGVSRSFPQRWYPLAVFVIALAMLYHTALISSYTWGWDVQQELFQANAVLTSEVWAINAPGGLTAVISITLLAPLSTLITGVSSIWLLKVFYPLLFAFVPLGLFAIFKKQTNGRVAFLAAVFVSLLFTFSTEMPALARQEIAELYVVLLLLLVVDKASHYAVRTKVSTYVLFALFTFALIVSHYMVALVLLAYLIIAWLLLFVIDNPAMRRLERSRLAAAGESSSNRRTMLSIVFIAAFVLFTYAWYTTMGAAVLPDISDGVKGLIGSLARVRILPIAIALGVVLYGVTLGGVYLLARRTTRTHVRGLLGLTPIVLAVAAAAETCTFVPYSLLEIGTLSPLHEIARWLYLLSIALVVTGFGALVMRRFRCNFDREYIALALASLLLLVGSTFVPYVAFAINTTRLFHLASLFIAPFFVVGMLSIVHVGQRTLRVQGGKSSTEAAYRVVAVILVATLLFNTGWMYEVFKQDPTSIALSNSIDGARFSTTEVSAAQWLYAARSPGNATPVYADAYRALLWASLDFPYYANKSEQHEIPVPANKTPHDGYVFLGTYNRITDQVAQIYSRSYLLNGTVIRHVDVNGAMDGRARLYDNGGADIYYS